jgi:hypothetical protein
MPRDLRDVDLSSAVDLTDDQLAVAGGNKATKLPRHLKPLRLELYPEERPYAD